MTRLFRKLRQLFCRHRWQVSRFQALLPGTGYECAKCGKLARLYFDGGWDEND